MKTIALGIDIGGAGPDIGLVLIATPPQESTSRKSSLTEVLFSVYSGIFETIGLPIFLGFGYAPNRRQYSRSPVGGREAT